MLPYPNAKNGRSYSASPCPPPGCRFLVRYRRYGRSRFSGSFANNALGLEPTLFTAELVADSVEVARQWHEVLAEFLKGEEEEGEDAVTRARRTVGRRRGRGKAGESHDEEEGGRRRGRGKTRESHDEEEGGRRRRRGKPIESHDEEEGGSESEEDGDRPSARAGRSGRRGRGARADRRGGTAVGDASSGSDA